MTQVSIVTDSAADLPRELVQQLGITVVPLVVRFGNQEYMDGELAIDEFWDRVGQGDVHPGTSQPPVGVFEGAFARLVEAGKQVLCITITGMHSGTFNSARVAAQPFGDRVRVLDSRSLSLGQGFQVIAAARAALGGLSLDDVARAVERLRERTQVIILLNTIEFVGRGGRADVLLPLLNRVTRVLRVKPLLNLDRGRLSLHSLAHSFERGLGRILQEIAELKSVESLAVVHVRCQEIAQRMAQRLADRLGLRAEDILLLETGPLLATHAGPKVIGVVYVQHGA